MTAIRGSGAQGGSAPPLPYERPLLIASRDRADAAMLLLIEAHQQDHERQAIHRSLKQQASAERVSHALDAANRLRELASKQRERAWVGMATDAVAVAAGVGTACVAPAAAPAVASGVSQLGRGVYDMATAGDEQCLQAQVKQQEALAELANETYAERRDAQAQAQQAIGGTFQQLQRYAESQQRAGDLALRVTE